MPNWLKSAQLSLRQRILLLTMFTTGVGLLLGSAGYLFYDARTARGQKLQQLELAADLIGTNATASLAFDDPGSAEKYLAALRTRPGFRGGVLYTPSGKILATYDAPDGLTFLPPSHIADGVVWEPQRLKLTAPVMSVRYVFTPAFCNRSSTSRRGCTWSRWSTAKAHPLTRWPKPSSKGPTISCPTRST